MFSISISPAKRGPSGPWKICTNNIWGCIWKAPRQIYPRQSPLWFCPVFCSIPIRHGSHLGLLPCSGCFSGSQQVSIHASSDSSQGFQSLLPSSCRSHFEFLTEEQGIHFQWVFARSSGTWQVWWAHILKMSFKKMTPSAPCLYFLLSQGTGFSSKGSGG